MPCIFNIKKEDRCYQYCSAVCDERQPKPVETFTTNLQYFGEVSKEEKTKMDSTQEVPTTEIDFEQELYKAFGQVKDFTLGMRIAKWFYDTGYHQAEKDFELTWNNVNDRLPKEEFDDGYTFVFVAIKLDEETYRFDVDYIRNGKWELHPDKIITHWMPIPPLPNTED